MSAPTAMEEDIAEQTFDLENYIGNYSGHTKIQRLLFIAEKSVGKALELEALKMAHDELKKTENTALYLDTVNKINGRAGPQYSLDRQWFDQVERQCGSRHDHLEEELAGFKTNLVKESIRLTHNDLGDFFYGRGDLQNAFKCYVRSRDYCSTSAHITAMCLRVMRSALELGQWPHVANYLGKAENTPDVQADALSAAKLSAVSGLVSLHYKKYKAAAAKFVGVSAELVGNAFNDVVAASDVAVYGTLCALASFDRNELKARVINNIGFKEFLELVPEMRELLTSFYHSRYTPCLALLEQLRPGLMLDLHLAPHVAALMAEIRSRALCQYVAPFTALHLPAMAAAFNTGVSDLEKELAALISRGSITARIDSTAQLLYARHANTRQATFSGVLAAGEAYQRDSKALLLRASLVAADFMQRSARQRPGPPERGDRERERVMRGHMDRMDRDRMERLERMDPQRAVA